MNNETVNISRESYDELRKKERQLKKLRVKVREGFKYFTLIKDGDEKETWYTNDEEIKHLVGQLKSAKEEVRKERELVNEKIEEINRLYDARKEDSDNFRNIRMDHSYEISEKNREIKRGIEEYTKLQGLYEKESKKASKLSYYIILAVGVCSAFAVVLLKLMLSQP